MLCPQGRNVTNPQQLHDAFILLGVQDSQKSAAEMHFFHFMSKIQKLFIMYYLRIAAAIFSFNMRGREISGTKLQESRKKI